jgi:hypothetical protein
MQSHSQPPPLEPDEASLLPSVRVPVVRLTLVLAARARRQGC